MQALDYVKNQYGEKGRFNGWMRNLETAVDGYSKIVSFVASSDEVRISDIGISNLFMEYVLATIFLTNIILDVPEEDL
jgi:cytokinesis protein